MSLDLYQTLQQCLAISNGLQLLKGASQGQFEKDNQNATMVPYNSIT
jgi:hypothetical protein